MRLSASCRLVRASPARATRDIRQFRPGPSRGDEPKGVEQVGAGRGESANSRPSSNRTGGIPASGFPRTYVAKLSAPRADPRKRPELIVSEQTFVGEETEPPMRAVIHQPQPPPPAVLQSDLLAGQTRKQGRPGTGVKPGKGSLGFGVEVECRTGSGFGAPGHSGQPLTFVGNEQRCGKLPQT